MYILAIGESGGYLEALRVRLRSVCSALEMVRVGNCWNALQQLKRADVHWDFVVICSLTVPLVDVDHVIGPVDPNVSDFITTVPPMEGGYHVIEQMRDLGIKPRLGVLCSYEDFEKKEAIPRIQAAGGVPVLESELFAECVRRVQGA